MRLLSYLIATALTFTMSFTQVHAQMPSWRPEMPQIRTFDEEAALHQGSYEIDVSGASEGVLIGSCSSPSSLKLQVVHDNVPTNYSIPNDGTLFTIPLTEDGPYTVSVMEHVEGTRYRTGWTIPLDVTLSGPFAPYLQPNLYVPYDRSPVAVQKAEELIDASYSLACFIKNVDSFARSSVTYDNLYTPTALSEHEVNPDKTLFSGTGICLDFASLATSMFRSQGVPAKLVFGYVTAGSTKDAYHAWTEVWDGTSWTIVDACMPEGYNAIYDPVQYF